MRLYYPIWYYCGIHSLLWSAFLTQFIQLPYSDINYSVHLIRCTIQIYTIYTNIGYRWHHYHGWRYNRLMLVSRHWLRTFTIFSQMPRLMLYKMYASDVHCLKIHTIWHMLISLILATDTLCTTDLYNICYAIIDMHIVTCYKTCHISRYVLRWIQNVDIHSDTYY